MASCFAWEHAREEARTRFIHACVLDGPGGAGATSGPQGLDSVIVSLYFHSHIGMRLKNVIQMVN